LPYFGCPTCNAQGAFEGCSNLSVGIPACPPLSCDPCSPLKDAVSCDAKPNCTSLYEEDTSAFQPAMKFSSCTSTPPACFSSGGICAQKKGVTCLSGYVPLYVGNCPYACAKDVVCPVPQSGECGTRDEAHCDGSCHPVYKDRDTCDCSTPGCCMGFSVCAPGPAICDVTAVTCSVDPPACGPGFQYSYRNGCYEGCVKLSECGLCCGE
jgi:hypothetical protein